MTNQKAENLLNLALETPESERVRTEELNVGYNPDRKTWEIIVKHSGKLRERLWEQFPMVTMRDLSGDFAILDVPADVVEDVINIEEIEYAEKPKRLYFAVNRAKAASCFLPVQSGSGAGNLSGCGVLVGIVDSGIDYFHEDFRREDGSSRILYLYDQVMDRVYTNEEINAALATGDRDEAVRLVPTVDDSGHGTAVAGIAAGNGRESGGRYRGAAYNSDLLVVRLGTPDAEGFPRTTQVMAGLDFIARKAVELERPVAVNLSFGNTYGSHDGTGLLERYMDQIAQIGRSVFVVGTGNEGDKAGHTSGNLKERVISRGGEGQMISGRTGNHLIELSVAPYETGFSVQLWKNYEDDFEIYLTNPARNITEKITRRSGAYALVMGETKVLVYYGEPGPFSEAQEIYFEFLPLGNYVESGIWDITLEPISVVRGQYDFWLPSSGALNRSTRFLRPVPDTTLTIPSTGQRPIAVGAYDDATNTYALFSGRGNTRDGRSLKPDLAAPGVDVIAPQRGGGYVPVTGTSFAAPLVTGASALLMEWGIINGNDPYLYGDKVKAYLKKGAKPLPGEPNDPNPRTGYGALCVADSIPE